jgi:hypothetical protein
MTALPSDPSTRSRTVMPTGFSLAATGECTHEAVKGSRLVGEGGPHGPIGTHAGQANRELLDLPWRLTNN